MMKRLKILYKSAYLCAVLYDPITVHSVQYSAGEGQGKRYIFLKRR